MRDVSQVIDPLLVIVWVNLTIDSITMLSVIRVSKYILTFNAKTVPKVITRLAFQMS